MAARPAPLDRAYATGGNEGNALQKESSSGVAASAKEPTTKKLDRTSQKQHRFSYADIGVEDNDNDSPSSSESSRGKKEVKEPNPVADPQSNLRKSNDSTSHVSNMRRLLMPPPQPILSRKPKPLNDIVNTGLNICFKRAHAFSQHPDSGGEPLGPIPSNFVPASSVVPQLDFVPVTSAANGKR